MSAALAEVKQELGPQAVILQTRSYVKNRWLGLRRREIFEITAGRDVRSPVDPAQFVARSPLPSRRSNRPSIRAASSSKSPPAKMPRCSDSSRKCPASRRCVKDLVAHADRTAAPAHSRGTVRLLLQLIQNQVAEELAGGHDQNPSAANPPRARSTRRNSSAPNSPSRSNDILPASGPIVRTKTTGPTSSP